ncbi:MAG TPA: alkaline phosphatase family protein [Solirubrobacteraceae bacterium]|jgi:hypothetical protein|nr:alkaline phosphatase family protein [Solirubrobacteraceae bacterium]
MPRPWPERRCAECGSRLAADQRYCLTCGARAGERAAAVRRLMAAARDSWRTAPPALAPTPRSPAAPSRWSRRIPGLPSPAISGALVAAFLGFGVLLGAAAASPPAHRNTPARLSVVLPPAAAAAATSPGGSSAEASGSGAEAPAAEAEATPAPSASTGKAASGKATTGSSGASPGAGESAGEGEGGGSGAAGSAPAKKLPPIKHVFVIMLSDEPYAQAFGPLSSSQYLSSTLLHQGELLTRYDAVAHEELANGIALLSGQGPTPETAANCPTYSPVAPAGAGAEGQVIGNGCIYPASTRTLMGELTSKRLRWRAYVEGTGEPGATPACSHPAPGASDPTANQAASTGPYATFRNPLVYFAGITAAPACAQLDAGIGALRSDLAKPASTPSFSYVVPDRCHDGNPTPCTPGAPAGMTAATSFLSRVVPEITSSTAFKQSGLLVITSDEAPSSGEYGDSSGCCGQPRYPNLPPPTGAVAATPRGGGAVGALLLSPYVKGGTTSSEQLNHFSLLRTVESLFGLAPIGYAAATGVSPFPAALFTAGRSG